MKLIAKLLKSDETVIGNCDDSAGVIGDCYRRAAAMFERVSRKCEDAKLIAGQIEELLENYAYDVRRGILNDIGGYLDRDSIDQLVADWRQRASRGFRSYIQTVESVGDPDLCESVSVLESPGDTVEVAQQYFRAGRMGEALDQLLRTSRVPWYSRNKYDSLLIRIHKKEGDREKLEAILKDRFDRKPKWVNAKAYLNFYKGEERERLRLEILDQINIAILLNATPVY